MEGLADGMSADMGFPQAVNGSFAPMPVIEEG